ncbi:BAG1 isoform 6 [Pongo abelii]|uniref:BAG1 isoform 6 n=1 Tax=Pongo abelii TaxID=9601 RepID=A0A2J8XIP5_PONAB|nr:BAG1 isoform 6 [Pongo abelii]
MNRSQEVTRDEEATRSEEVTRKEMAAAGLTVTITHSNEKHDLHVTPKQGSSEPVVQDLAQVVEEVIGVPQSFQKLIFKVLQQIFIEDLLGIGHFQTPGQVSDLKSYDDGRNLTIFDEAHGQSSLARKISEGNGNTVVNTWNTRWLPGHVNWEKEQSTGRG